MAGWRDSEGRTGADRKKQHRAANRVQFLRTVKARPMSVLWTTVLIALALILATALVLR